MGSAADLNPADDLFYRETLRSLGRELSRLGSGIMQLNRTVPSLTEAVVEMTVVTAGLRDVMRDLKDELVIARTARRHTATAPPAVVSRTKTGG